MSRFVRLEKLLGENARKKLESAQVAIVGLGAIGSVAAEALARSAVGNLCLYDFDIIRESNFNRQLLATTPALGRFKVEVAAERIAKINNKCKVQISSEFVAKENITKIFESPLSKAPTILIDAIDCLGPKVDLIAYAHQQRIPIISSMGAGNKIDPLSVKFGDIAVVNNCPLGKRIFKRLKKIGISSGVLCVYSDQPVIKSEINKQSEGERENKNEEPEFFERGRKRQPVGTIAHMSGIFGFVAAYLAIELITENKNYSQLLQER